MKLRHTLLALLALVLLCAAGAYAATVVTELHPYSQTVTISSKGKQQVFTVSGTITDLDTYPDPSTVTVTVTAPATTAPPTTTTAPPPPPSGTIFISPFGNDASSCTPVAPCQSLARAYAVAASGDTVEVLAGTYPTQNFAGGYQASQPAGTKAVTFHGQPGNEIRQLHSGSPNIVYDGINVDAAGQKTSGAGFENGGQDGVVFRNGSIANVNDEKGALIGGNILIDNVNFHDVTLTTDGVHNECLFVLEAEGATIRNSTFTNCRTMGILFTTCGPCTPNYGHVTVEGNTLNPVTGGDQTIHFGWIGANGSIGTMNNWVVRNNVLTEPVFFDPGVGSPVLGTGNVFCGNTGSVPPEWTGGC